MKELLKHGEPERLRVILGFAIGFLLLIEFGALSFCIALGQVKAETSYGLGMVLGGLNTAIGAFSGFAWGLHRKPGSPDIQEESPKEFTEGPPEAGKNG